jgi:hypothetical protein
MPDKKMPPMMIKAIVGQQPLTSKPTPTLIAPTIFVGASIEGTRPTSQKPVPIAKPAKTD